jgi:hypothetical protein
MSNKTLQQLIEDAKKDSPLTELRPRQVVARISSYDKTSDDYRKQSTIRNRKLAGRRDWIEKVTEKNLELSKDPNWLEANRKGSLKRKKLGEQLKNEGRIEERNRLFGYIEKHSEITIEKMKASARARWAKTQRRVQTDQGIFESIYKAGEALGCHPDTIKYRIKKGRYSYLD